MTSLPRRPPLAVLVTLALLLAACSSAGSSATPTTEAPTASATSEDTPTPEAVATRVAPSRTVTPTPAQSAAGPISAARVLDHVEHLAGAIGPRPAGTDAEAEAAAYLAGHLQAAGYDVAIEPFTFTTRTDASTLSAGESVAITPLMLNGSAEADATGPLVYGGLGSPDDLAPLALEGAILLLDRGILPFAEKARNAELAGAIAVVIANTEDEPFLGSLGERPTTIPVVAIRRSEGDLLRPLADARAPATLHASIDTIEAESRNVVARDGDTCRYLLGAHYDSVPAAPGANDNASGTALILELARVHRTDGLCVVAFGAEELGLFGSEAFVRDHDLTAVDFMLNFDVVGRLDGPIIIGDPTLTTDLLALLDASEVTLPIEAGAFPRFASSDHVSFANAGIPAVTITSGNDPLLHTSADAVPNVLPPDIEAMTTAADTLLAALLPTP